VIEKGESTSPPTDTRHDRKITEFMKRTWIFLIINVLIYETLGNSPPVDVVITWLNDTSVEWQEKFLDFKSSHTKKHPNPKTAGDSSISRYRDFFILDYVVASCCINIPWLQTIHIVISDLHGPPNWELEKTDYCRNIPIKIHTHRELLSYSRYNEEAILPTFNSFVIELLFQFIPGLAEYFFYVNDDQVISKPLLRNQVFVGANELPVFYLGEHRGYRGGPRSDPEIPWMFTANSLKLVAELEGLDKEKIMEATEQLSWSMHAPIFFKRDWLFASFQKVGVLVGITLTHHTRSTHDIVYTMSLYPYYLLLYHPNEVHWITSIPFPYADSLEHSEQQSMNYLLNVEILSSMSTEEINDLKKYQYLGIQDECGELSRTEFIRFREQVRERLALLLSIPQLPLQVDSAVTKRHHHLRF
jgi:hypothetical protein